MAACSDHAAPAHVCVYYVHACELHARKLQHGVAESKSRSSSALSFELPLVSGADTGEFYMALDAMLERADVATGEANFGESPHDCFLFSLF